MDVLTAIATRRSTGKVTPETPPRELIEKMLDAAVQAPNHYQTRPWRFWVLAGKAREQLGQAMADALRRTMENPESEQSRALLAREAEKPLRAPVLIVVGTRRSDNPRAIPIEDIEATAAAVQNMLLAAHALGLGAMWRTGDAAYNPDVKRFFGLDPEDHLAAFIYVGYPAVTPPPRERAVGDTVVWKGWE